MADEFTMDAVSEERLALVHPLLATKIRAMAEKLAAQGVVIRVVQGLRTKAEQDALYAQGRTAPGKIVTNAPGGHSWHNYGFAVDCIPGLRGVTPWEPNWNENDPDFVGMIYAGIAEGLVSGARWHSIPDEPHFQLAGIPVSPDATAQQLVAANPDVTAIWAHYEAVLA